LVAPSIYKSGCLVVVALNVLLTYPSLLNPCQTLFVSKPACDFGWRVS
jgi:hypothetical protein